MTENNIPPTCKRCGTLMYSFADDGEGFLTDRCPLDPKDCELKSLRSVVEALRKRNEEDGATIKELMRGLAGAIVERDSAESRAQELEKRNEELEQNNDWLRRNNDSCADESQLIAAESRAQEAETKLRAAEDARKQAADAVVVLHDGLAKMLEWYGDASEVAYHAKLALSNTSALAAQRKREIQREAVEASLPARRSGESYDLRSDGYQRGWNDCLDVINRTILNPKAEGPESEANMENSND